MSLNDQIYKMAQTKTTTTTNSETKKRSCYKLLKTAVLELEHPKQKVVGEA